MKFKIGDRVVPSEHCPFRWRFKGVKVVRERLTEPPVLYGIAKNQRGIVFYYSAHELDHADHRKISDKRLRELIDRLAAKHKDLTVEQAEARVRKLGYDVESTRFRDQVIAWALEP